MKRTRIESVRAGWSFALARASLSERDLLNHRCPRRLSRRMSASVALLAATAGGTLALYPLGW